MATRPQWDKTLLIVFYDEHGGFYDHVPPPEVVDDDPKMFGRYGMRVPALIVSRRVQHRSASKTLFDHASIIKTILLRFCAADLKHPKSPGEPVHLAQSGPSALSGNTRRARQQPGRPP
jgi:phospholipase C